MHFILALNAYLFLKQPPNNWSNLLILGQRVFTQNYKALNRTG